MEDKIVGRVTKIITVERTELVKLLVGPTRTPMAEATSTPRADALQHPPPPTDRASENARVCACPSVEDALHTLHIDDTCGACRTEEGGGGGGRGRKHALSMAEDGLYQGMMVGGHKPDEMLLDYDLIPLAVPAQGGEGGGGREQDAVMVSAWSSADVTRRRELVRQFAALQCAFSVPQARRSGDEHVCMCGMCVCVCVLAHARAHTHTHVHIHTQAHEHAQSIAH